MDHERDTWGDLALGLIGIILWIAASWLILVVFADPARAHSRSEIEQQEELVATRVAEARETFSSLGTIKLYEAAILLEIAREHLAFMEAHSCHYYGEGCPKPPQPAPAPAPKAITPTATTETTATVTSSSSGCGDAYNAVVFNPCAFEYNRSILWLGTVARHFGDIGQTNVAMCVMYGESRGNALAQNASGARGLFQIMPNWANNTYAGTAGISYSDFYDGETNAFVARKVYDLQGWGAWSAYRRGYVQDCIRIGAFNA